MATPRKFWLQNSHGDRLPLSEGRDNGMFVINPKGLGVELSPTTEVYGTDIRVNNMTYKPTNFTVDLILGQNWPNRSPYELYLDVIKWIDRNDGDYVLGYSNANGEFLRDCELIKAPMSDLDEGLVINETLEFLTKSLWYQEVIFQQDELDELPTGGDGVGKLYDESDKIPAYNHIAYSTDATGAHNFTTHGDSLITRDLNAFRDSVTGAGTNTRPTTTKMDGTSGMVLQVAKTDTAHDRGFAVDNVTADWVLDVPAPTAYTAIVQVRATAGAFKLNVGTQVPYAVSPANVTTAWQELHIDFTPHAGAKNFYVLIEPTKTGTMQIGDVKVIPKAGFTHIGTKQNHDYDDPTTKAGYSWRALTTAELAKPLDTHEYGSRTVITRPGTRPGVGRPYGYTYSDDFSLLQTRGTFTLSNDSLYMGLNDGSPLEIIIPGSSTGVVTTNPSWTITKPGESKPLSSDGYKLTIPVTQELVVRSWPGNAVAFLRTKADKEFVASVYLQQDHNKTNFCRVPIGESELAFDKAYAGVQVMYRKEYVFVG